MAIPHPREIQLAVVNWLDERYPFTKAVDEALYQRVPNFANAFYYCFGGMVFILIVFLLLTGVLLALYYVPDASGNPAPAYQSVQFIQNTVYLGWLIRGVHFWSANLLIIMVLVHMARVYWTGSYRAPRELNWMVGVLMLLIILSLSLTGYLLPWVFFFSSRRRHTRLTCDWSSDVCSSDLRRGRPAREHGSADGIGDARA